MNLMLTKASTGKTFTIKTVEGQEKSKKFLFSLGCFEGEKITLVSTLAGMYVVNIKDSRYALDERMAKTIVLEI